MTRFVLGLAILVASSPAFAQNAQTITVRNLTLVNLNQVPVEDYQQIVRFALDNTKFPPAKDWPATIPQRVRYALQERGYFRAEVGNPETTVVSETAAEKIVDVAVRVNAGSIYTIESLILAGNRAVPAEQLRAQLPFSPGDVFDIAKVRAGMDNLRKFYADNGYIDFTPKSNTQVIDGTDWVMQRITLKEGERFYFGDLQLARLALPPEAAQSAIADWSSLKGQPYSETRLQDFMKRHADLLPTGFQSDRNLGFSRDAKTHSVSVEVVP